ncbi:MAG: DUF6785 family protein [Candidatus Bathyarchaeia archaeon]
MTGQEVPEVELKSALTPKVLAVGIALVFLTVIAGVYINAFSKPGAFVRYWVDNFWGAGGFTGFAFALTFITMIAVWIQGRLKIDPKKFTVLYAMVMTACAYVSSYGYPFQPVLMLAQFRMMPATINNWGRVYPSWFPSEAAAKAIVPGGISVPWADWMPGYMVFLAWVLIDFTMLASLNLIFRRQWIDVERMEFPHAVIGAMAVNITSDIKGNSVKFKRMLIGFIPIFIFTSQFWLGIWYPWFPSLASTMLKAPWIGWHPGVFDIFWAAPALWDVLPGAAGLLNAWPWFWAISFLLPLNMLLSAFVFGILGQIVFPVALIYSGVWTPRPVVTAGWSSHSSWVTEMSVTQMPAFEYGMWIALSLFPLLLRGNWRYIRDTLRGTLSKAETASGGISYRVAWGLFIISFVLFLGFMMVALQVDFNAALLTLTVWTVIAIGIVRVRGMSGVNVTTVGESYGGLARIVFVNTPQFANIQYSKLPTDATPSLFGTLYYTTNSANDNQQCSFWSVGALNMEAYKLGALNRVRPKDITVATFLAAIVAAIVAFPLLLQLTYARGVKPEGIVALFGMAGAFTNVGTSNVGDAWTKNTTPEATALYYQTWATYFVVGIVFMAAVVWAFMTFPWFSLHPVGVMVGMGNFLLYGLPFTMAIVYVFKWLILKYGGIKTYEDWVVPIMLGVVLGNAVGCFIWGIAGIAVGW